MTSDAASGVAQGRMKYLVVKGRGGLGNRLLAVATGILYARLSDRRMIVDWSDWVYSADGSNVFPRLFELAMCAPDDELPVTDSIAPALWRDLGSSPLGASIVDPFRERARRSGGDAARPSAELVNASSIDLTRLDHPERIVVMWVTGSMVGVLRATYRDVVPGFPRGNSPEIVRDILGRDVALARAISERVERFAEEQFGRLIVGMHVRYTDKKARLHAIRNRLDVLLACEPDLGVFLATDNRSIRDRLERRYPGLISTPHWYPDSGAVLHKHESRPDPFEICVAALVDLYLLAVCDYLICDTTSSFARVAMLLSKAPESHVFDVKGDAAPRPGGFPSRLDPRSAG